MCYPGTFVYTRTSGAAGPLVFFVSLSFYHHKDFDFDFEGVGVVVVGALTLRF